MVNHPEIFWGVIVSMYVGNVILLIMNVPMISVCVACCACRTTSSCR